MDIKIVEIKHIHEITLDYSESVKENYKLCNNELLLFEYACEIPNLEGSAREQRKSNLSEILQNDGVILNDICCNRIVGIASLKNKLYRKGRMQLYSLHIDREFRGKGIGKSLFEGIEAIAKEKCAKGLYISASPKKNTIDFYLKQGAIITKDIEEELYREEPEDIHLEKMWRI